MVIMPAGVPRKPGMTRDDLFKVRLPGLQLRLDMPSVTGALNDFQRCRMSALLQQAQGSKSHA